MSELVERVARAIYDIDPVGMRGWADAPASTREQCLILARAAIEAMREPTGEMKDAGAATYGPFPALNLDGQPSKAWRAMIGAALGG